MILTYNSTGTKFTSMKGSSGIILKLLCQIELIHTTQVSSTFCVRWLANSEVISQVLFTSEQPKKIQNGFCRYIVTNEITLQLVWYILKQLFTSVSVKVVDIYLPAR